MFTTAAPFLPTDSMLTSEGVAKFPYANVPAGPAAPTDPPAQLGLAGVYQPTVNPDPSLAQSTYPGERDPAITLTAFQGDLGLGSGQPQSVYDIDSRQIALGRLTSVGTKTLRPGGSWTLPDGSTVEFLGTKEWITVSIRHDPGEGIVLLGAGAILVGLMVSLSGKRRRIWARVAPHPDGGSLITLGGLARTEYPGFAEEFAAVAELAGGEPAQGEPRPADDGAPDQPAMTEPESAGLSDTGLSDAGLSDAGFRERGR